MWLLRICTNLLMFSIILNSTPVECTLRIAPGLRVFMTWHNTWPSLMMSSYLSLGWNFLPRTVSIHSNVCLSCSGSRFPKIYNYLYKLCHLCLTISMHDHLISYPKSLAWEGLSLCMKIYVIKVKTIKIFVSVPYI